MEDRERALMMWASFMEMDFWRMGRLTVGTVRREGLSRGDGSTVRNELTGVRTSALCRLLWIGLMPGGSGRLKQRVASGREENGVMLMFSLSGVSTWRRSGVLAGDW